MGGDLFLLNGRVSLPLKCRVPISVRHVAMSPLANQTNNWRNGICVFSPIWRNQLNDNSIPMEKHFDCFH